VPKERLSDKELRSDLRLLGATLEEVERGKRRLELVEEDPTSRNTRKNLKRALSEARKRGCTVELMPESMSKHLRNKTRFDPASDSIVWTIDWIEKDCLLASSFGSDASVIKELIPQAYKDRVEQIRLELFQADPCVVDLDVGLKDLLSGKSIIEFPTFRIQLK
jgi:hypothetical protein